MLTSCDYDYYCNDVIVCLFDRSIINTREVCESHRAVVVSESLRVVVAAPARREGHWGAKTTAVVVVVAVLRSVVVGEAFHREEG